MRAGRDKVCQSDLEESVEVVIAGYQKKNKILSNKEKLNRLLSRDRPRPGRGAPEPLGPGHKITIIPRTSGALGYTMQVDQEEHNLMSREELENKIATLTGGRVAEELALHSVTTGASNDIEQATRLARAYISRFGMSEDFGMVAFEQIQTPIWAGDASMACADQTAARSTAWWSISCAGSTTRPRRCSAKTWTSCTPCPNTYTTTRPITGDEFMKLLEQPKLDMGPAPEQA